MKHTYSPEDENILRDTAILNTDAAARVGVGEATVRRWRKANGVAVGPRAKAVPAPEDTVSREELLEDELRELKAAHRKVRRLDVAQERVLQAVERSMADADLTLHIVDPKARTAADPAAHHRQAVLLSDWHGGEVVRSAEVGGLNEFNWTILEQRVDRVVESLLSFKRVRPALTGLDLWFLGDFVSGDIHEELTATNEFPVAEQAVRVGKLIASVVARLAPHYPDLHCCAVAGNHARTKKPHASKSIHDSWDWTAYKLAEAMTSQIENVTWEIPEAGTIVRQVAGMNWLLWHGDGVRSSMPGVPAGGVTRRANEYRKQYSGIGVHLDGLACGHFHSVNLWQGNVLINGSAIGTNEFGYKCFGGGEAPKQVLVTFDEKRSRVTDYAIIDLA